MRKLTFAQFQREHMARYAKRSSTAIEYGEVTNRTAAGRYSVTVSGTSASGLTAIGGEFGVGQTVRVSRGGPGAATYQIDGAAPISRRANQPPRVFEVVMTTSSRLR